MSFANPKNLGDLEQRQLFVVVERHDQLLALGKTTDGTGDGFWIDRD